MAKKKSFKDEYKKTITSPDTWAELAAISYFFSVLTVAHHVSEWAHNGSSHIVPLPAWGLAVISLALCAYSGYKAKKLSTSAIVSITIVITASIFWLSGLRTNFFF